MVTSLGPGWIIGSEVTLTTSKGEVRGPGQFSQIKHAFCHWQDVGSAELLVAEATGGGVCLRQADKPSGHQATRH